MTKRCTQHDFHWYPARNEQGWKCCSCGYRPGEPPGFSPQLDRDEVERKVGGLLMELAAHDLVGVSNGTAGEGITAAVADECVRLDQYDQGTILRLLIGAAEDGGAEYWRKVSDGILKGRDPRERCKCGALATHYSHHGSQRVASCSAHVPKWDRPLEELPLFGAGKPEDEATP